MDGRKKATGRTAKPTRSKRKATGKADNATVELMRKRLFEYLDGYAVLNWPEAAEYRRLRDTVNDVPESLMAKYAALHPSPRAYCTDYIAMMPQRGGDYFKENLVINDAKHFIEKVLSNAEVFDDDEYCRREWIGTHLDEQDREEATQAWKELVSDLTPA